MKIAALFIIALSACTTVEVEVKPAKTGFAWTCYTHAICAAYNGGQATNESHRLCLDGNPDRDVLEPGDAAASDYSQIWTGACEAEYGLIGTEAEGRYCASPDLAPASFGCTVNCQPLFEGC